MHDVRVTNIDNACARAKVCHVVFIALCASVAKAKKSRYRADGTRAKPRTRAPLHAKIIGRADQGHIRADCKPIGLVVVFAKCGDTCERQV